jgi:pyruvate formate lyase activating enzyme
VIGSGSVFDISRGCVDDGPGLRTVVFLQGCNLGCPWCHNPEGLSREPLIGRDDARCIRCGRCFDACHRDWSIDEPDAWRAGCVVCGRCVHACPSGARRLVGHEITPADLVREVLEDRDFFDGTGGGVTFSGGEPLLQADFLFDCADRLAREGVHVAVETAGLWSPRLIPRLVAAADLILFDLKHVDTARLERATGRGECGHILGNLSSLLEDDGVNIELRVTLVPGFNADPDDLVAFAKWLVDRRRVPPVRLQGFHRLAVAKTQLYGVPYAFSDVEPVSDRELAAAARLLEDHGVSVMEV